MRTVLKLGGNALGDDALLDAVAAGLAPGTVIVHGGGPTITSRLEERRIPATFHAGRRVTTPEVMAIVHEVLCGQVNPDLVGRLAARGIHAVGFRQGQRSANSARALESRAAAGPIHARLRDPQHLGRVGSVTGVEIAALEAALVADRTPVVAPVALADDGGLANVNADDAALAVARALGATRLLLISDVPGVLLDGELRAELNAETAERGIADGAIAGGMRVKVEQALSAAREGITVMIGDATVLVGGGTSIPARSGRGHAIRVA